MADIRDWGAFMRSRWNWTRFGYELGFPRGCQFTDVDAGIEFDGQTLLIETKSHDGLGDFVDPPWGQLCYLRNEARLGKTVIILYGCGVCNNPWAVKILQPQQKDRIEDWRDLPLADRRKLLKHEIDQAMGLTPKESEI